MIYEPTFKNIKTAAALLRKGELVVFPTETVYGLAANAADDTACKKIYTLKGRPGNNPLIIHIASAADLSQVADIDAMPHIRPQISALSLFWPGPLSLVLPKKAGVSNVATAGLNSVAVRIPGHEVAQKLLREAGIPLAAPSANRSSYVSPTTAQHIEEDFKNEGLFVLDGGACRVGIESTIISLLQPKPALLRPGAITLEQLEKALGPVELTLQVRTADGTTSPLAPGALPVHYAPRTPLYFIAEAPTAAPSSRVGLLSFASAQNINLPFDCVKLIGLSRSGSMEEVASRIYAGLRELDCMNLDFILVDSCSEEGIGRAIMDRLLRASAHTKL